MNLQEFVRIGPPRSRNEFGERLVGMGVVWLLLALGWAFLSRSDAGQGGNAIPLAFLVAGLLSLVF